MKERKKYFSDKPFKELNREDMDRMVRDKRVRMSYTTEEMMEHYGVDIDEYCAKIREVGLKISRWERKTLVDYRQQKKLSAPIETRIKQRKVAGYELRVMRKMRNKSIAQLARMTGEYEHWLRMVERSHEVPERMVKVYTSSLGIKNAHLEQFRKIIKGETSKFDEDRNIPPVVRREVMDKYGYECAHCSSMSRLQIHHREHFAKGGQHNINNLILLCAHCHAEEHRDETVYNLIKSRGDE